MRIVGGRFRGKTLRAPDGRVTRPTSDRAREAIFNILEHAPWSDGLEGGRVLDLFAGSGALGFEALSRGAVFSLFVETDATARGVIRENAEALDLLGVTRIHRRGATDLGVKPAGLGRPFDWVFLDPPYRTGLGDEALSRLAEGGWIDPGALAVLETAEDEQSTAPGFEVLDRRVYGAAQFHFLRSTGST